MILFKQCPRCGGDVECTFLDDVHCVQCAYRPDFIYPGPRAVLRGSRRQKGRDRGSGRDQRPMLVQAARANGRRDIGYRPISVALPCPRCACGELEHLEKLRSGDNSCYRYRDCGHIYSPRLAATQ